jgi:broad-complex core protein
MEASIQNHTAPPFLMSPGDKLFPPPGSFNFSMAALADPAALASESYFSLLELFFDIV